MAINWDAIQKAADAGAAFRFAKVNAEQEQEARKLQMDILKHHVGNLKLQDQLEKFKALTGQPAPTVTTAAPEATPQSYPDQVGEGPSLGGGTQQVPAPLPSVTLPFESGNVQVTPPSMQQLLQQQNEANRREILTKLAEQVHNVPEGGTLIGGLGNVIGQGQPKTGTPTGILAEWAQIGFPALKEQFQAQGKVPTAKDIEEGFKAFSAKAATETPHTVTTAKGVFQYNPQTGRYDIYVGPPNQAAGVGITVATVNDPNNPGQQMPVLVDKRTGIAKPVTGTAGDQLTKSTAQELNREGQAAIISNYADHILQMIDANPGIVGPIAGRIARGETVIGNVSPEAKALGTALGSMIALQPILHGYRGGSQATDHFNQVLGDQRLNAAALKASINELKTLAMSIGTQGGQNIPGAKAPTSSAGWSVKVKK